MALIRPNNKALSNITTLPSGITEYNLQGSDLPSGTVIQVNTGTTTTLTSTESSSFVPTAMSVVITPKNVTSKILITVNGSLYHYTNAQSALDVFRNGTSVTGTTNGFELTWLESTRGVFSGIGQVIDEPSTTNELTYTVYIRKRSGDFTIQYPTGIGGDGVKTIITAMEIAG
jgi:hypothetical protein